MPFLITTKSPSEIDCVLITRSRRAVATLEESRTLCDAEAEGTDAHWYQRDDITESGGSVGPLPDGTVIQVEPVTGAWLARHLDSDDVDGRSAIDAYNARQATE